MKRLVQAGFLIALFMPTVAMAQSSFDGTWKIDLSKVELPKKPDVLLLQGGMYQCKTCIPAINIKADGQDQKVSGDPYVDSMSIKVVDDHTVLETDKKGGKTVGTSTTTVSKDGTTAAFEFTDSSNTNGAPVTGKGMMTRVEKGPAGSHAISGSWRTSKLDSVSDNGLQLTFKVEGDSLHMSDPTGHSYAAKLDGTDAPYKGDPGTTSVSVKRISKDVIEETDKRDGKAISIAKMTVSEDGKTITFDVNNVRQGTTSKFVGIKQ
ncbi:MAG TPA: hypothetical protein VNV41_09010 [Candidatus Acidoferrales bacterium]|jgi:hypothetical protein|nr:hypothetical protein [Candidatus Acidoferrales bacterium]